MFSSSRLLVVNKNSLNTKEVFCKLQVFNAVYANTVNVRHEFTIGEPINEFITHLKR